MTAGGRENRNGGLPPPRQVVPFFESGCAPILRVAFPLVARGKAKVATTTTAHATGTAKASGAIGLKLCTTQATAMPSGIVATTHSHNAQSDHAFPRRISIPNSNCARPAEASLTTHSF